MRLSSYVSYKLGFGQQRDVNSHVPVASTVLPSTVFDRYISDIVFGDLTENGIVLGSY